MRLAFIGQSNSIHFRRRTTWFADRGHDVLVLCQHWPELHEDYRNCQVEMLPRELDREPLEAARWLREHILDFAPDAFHAHKCDHPGRLALITDLHPLVVSLWDGIHVRDPRLDAAQRALIHLMGRKADLFTTNSPGLLNESIHRGIPAERAMLTSWGVSASRFNMDHAPDDPALETLRRQYGLAPDEQVVFSPRVLTGFSNLDVVVAAMIELDRIRKRPFKLLMASYAWTDEGLWSFGQRLAGLNCRHRVVWCGRLSEEAELLAHYRLADVTLSLYSGYLESSPASIIESMLCGSLPVAADHPVMDFWVDHGENGFLTPARDPSAVALALDTALDMVRDHPEVLRRNHDRVLRQAHFEGTMQSLETAYADLRRRLGPVREHHPEPARALYEQGLLLDACGHAERALARYNKAADMGEEDARGMAATRRQEIADTGPFVFPEAMISWRSGDARGLGPPPSGDARDYVRAILRDGPDHDPERVRAWLEAIAAELHYDTAYLEALVMADDETSGRPWARRYLEAHRPVHAGLAPGYAALGREAEAGADPQGAQQWYALAETGWHGFDARFRHLLGRGTVLEAAWCLFRLSVLAGGERSEGRLAEARSLAPDELEGWLARGDGEANPCAGA